MKKFIYSTLFISLILFGAACGSKNTEQATNASSDSTSNDLVSLTESQFKNVGIKLGSVSTQKITTKIKTNGTLDVPPQNLIHISAPYGGFLKSTELLQGMHVHKGDVIAVMEHPDYIQLQQDYLENKSALAFAKGEYERQQTLSKEDVSSKKTLQKAKAEFETLSARVQGLRAKLELIRINMTKLDANEIQKTIELRAPINGYVTKIHASIGAFVTANTVLFEIVDTEHLHAEISVFEKDINSIKIGQKVSLVLPNESEPRYAKVYLIGKEITPERTVRVHCHLDKEDTNLLPGMYLTAYVDVQGLEATTLPEKGVVEFEGHHYVFEQIKHEGGKYTFKRIEVQHLESENGIAAIYSKEDLSGKNLVTDGAYQLLSAMMNTAEE
jgi:cobalt-zinc-cadmium efflux system membrane fusion protein